MSQVCTHCYTEGNPLVRKRGYGAVTWALFIMFFIGFTTLLMAGGDDQLGPAIWGIFLLGVVHAIFRSMSAKQLCPSCGSTDPMIPIESPRARELLAGRASSKDAAPAAT